MKPTTRKLLAVAEFAVCMAKPIGWTTLGVFGIAKSFSPSAALGLLLIFVGALGIVGVAWALVYDLRHGEPPTSRGVNEIMGGFIAIGCVLAVSLGFLAGLAVIAAPGLRTFGFWLLAFGLPLAHGMRRLLWLARADVTPPRVGTQGSAPHGS